MEKFDKEGVQKLADMVNGDVKTVLDRLKAVEMQISLTKPLTDSLRMWTEK